MDGEQGAGGEDLVPGYQVLGAASGPLAGGITWAPQSAQWRDACVGILPSSCPTPPGPRAAS